MEYSNDKLFDAFNLAKSVWNIVFDSVELSIKKNKEHLALGSGYIFYYRKLDNKIYVWEYEIKKKRGEKDVNQTHITKMYENIPDSTRLVSIIEEYSKFNKTDYYKGLPVFEMVCNQDFPMDEAIVPIMKRKLMSYIFQIVNINKTKNFDSKI